MPEKSDTEEYEIIPVSPLRRLEKRIDELEVRKEKFSGEEFLREIVDIIKMNQSIVEEMAKANDSLKIEIAKLPAKIDNLLNSINELVSYIKSAATEEAIAPSAVTEPLVSKLNEIAVGNKRMVELSETMVAALEEIDRKMRRTQPPAPLRRPPLQLPPTLR